MHHFERYAFYVLLFGLALAILGYLGAILAGFKTSPAWGVSLLIFPPAVIPFFLTNARRVIIPSILLGTGALLIAAPFAVNAISPIFVDLGPFETKVDGELHLTLTGWDRQADQYDAVLRARTQATVVQMANPDVTDASVKSLVPLKNLRELDLNGTQISDAGLETLATLPKLQILRLRGTPITEQGFTQHLAPLDSLMELDLRGTAVSSATVRAWKEAKPGRKALR